MSRALSLLLIVLDFHIGTSSPILCLPIASLDLTSSSHDASELNRDPKYLNDEVYAPRDPCNMQSLLSGSDRH